MLIFQRLTIATILEEISIKGIFLFNKLVITPRQKEKYKIYTNYE